MGKIETKFNGERFTSSPLQSILQLAAVKAGTRELADRLIDGESTDFGMFLHRCRVLASYREAHGKKDST